MNSSNKPNPEDDTIDHNSSSKKMVSSDETILDTKLGGFQLKEKIGEGGQGEQIKGV